VNCLQCGEEFLLTNIQSHRELCGIPNQVEIESAEVQLKFEPFFFKSSIHSVVMHAMVSWKVRKIECNLVQYYCAYKLMILSKLIKYIHVQVLRNMSLLYHIPL
jgi:hypothetical protein